MENIIEGINTYEGKICIMGCMTSILNYRNANISEELLLGLGIGLQFRFSHIIESNYLEVHCLDLVLDKKHLFEFCSDYLGINIIHKKFPTLPEIIESIKSELSRNRPVLLVVNSNDLEYWPDFLRVQSGHFIICYGWNDPEGYAMVIDSFIPSRSARSYKGKISLESLEKALDCSKLSFGTEYALWSFAPHDIAPKALDNIITESFGYSYRSMSNVNNCTFNWGSLNMDYECGLKGIKELECLLCSISKEGIDDNNRDVLGQVFSLLTSYAGPAPSRALYSCFLAWCEKKGFLPSEMNLSGKYLTISNEWKVLGNVLLRSSQSSCINSLNRGIERIRKIYELEAAALNNMKEVFI